MSSKKKDLTDLELQIKYDEDFVVLKSELQSVRQKYHNLLKKGNVYDRLVEYNKEFLKALPANKPSLQVKPKANQEVESAILLGSCYHIGERIPKEEVPGNEYSFETFCKRMQYVVDEIVTHVKSQSNVHYDELVYCLLGDIVSGVIHSLEITNEFNIVQQTQAGAYVIAEAVRELAQIFPKVKIYGIAGNHGRTKQEKEAYNKQTLSWDYVLYTNLALLLQNVKNVEVVIPQTWYAEFEVKGHKFFCTHGDTLKNGTGSPLNQVVKDASNWNQIKGSSGKPINYYITSHYHQKAETQTINGFNMMSGCMKGTCTYAQNQGYWSDPIQTFFTLGKQGRKTNLDINVKYQNYSKSRYAYSLNKALSEQFKK